jgi:hypothetical protein
MITITDRITKEEVEQQLRENTDPVTVEFMEDVFRYVYLKDYMRKLGYRLNQERIYEKI